MARRYAAPQRCGGTAGRNGRGVRGKKKKKKKKKKNVPRERAVR